MGRVTLKTESTRPGLSLVSFFFSPTASSLSFSCLLFSLSLSPSQLSHGSNQGHHGQGPCSLIGTMRRSSLTTDGGGFWFGLLPLSLFSVFFFSHRDSSRLTLSLDFGEPVYGSWVLCEPVCVAMWVMFRVNLWVVPWVVDVWPWPCDCGFIVERMCVCCDCEACRVWVVPWVIVWCGLIFLVNL